MLTGVFARAAIGGDSAKGLIEGNAHQVIVQLEAIGVTVVYCGIVSFILLKAIDMIIGLRVDEETERGGLDSYLHGEVVQ